MVKSKVHRLHQALLWAYARSCDTGMPEALILKACSKLFASLFTLETSWMCLNCPGYTSPYYLVTSFTLVLIT